MARSAPVILGTAPRLSACDDHVGLALFAAIDGVEDFLLREAVVVGEPFE